MNNFQRERSISNSHIGRAFENEIMEYFYRNGLDLDFDIGISIGIKYKKNKKFDFAFIDADKRDSWIKQRLVKKEISINNKYTTLKQS